MNLVGTTREFGNTGTPAPTATHGAARPAAPFTTQLRKLGYYLTYHRWATRRQVEAGYPQFVEFLRLKRKYDPDERFQSDWYRHYRAMFAAAL